MNRKYDIQLSENERKGIQEMMTAAKTPKGIRNRCNVLLQADENAGRTATHAEIMVRCGVSDVTVYTIIKEYATQGVEYCLRRRHTVTSPNPPIVTGEKVARIVALACGAAPEGRSRWSLRLLAEKVVSLEIMDAVSHATIRTTLKKHNLSLI